MAYDYIIIFKTKPSSLKEDGIFVADFIYDTCNSLIKEFFAKLKELFVGRPELTEIEQLEQRFLEVANKVKEMNAAEAEQQKTTTESGSGGKYSIVTLDSGKSYVKASRRAITGNTVAEQRKEITDFFNEALKNGPIEIETDEGDVLTISKETADKARDINITGNGVTRKLSKNEFLVKLHAEAHIDELTEISTKIKKPIAPDTKNHDFAKDGWTYRSVYFQDFDDSYYKITLSVGENNGVSTVYNVGKIKAENIPNGNIVSAIGSKADMSSARHSIPENEQPVNNNYAQSGTRYSFAGPKALTANQENLTEAEKREKSRKKSERDSENIRRELGWFRGLDRMWRYEIDDSKAKFALPRFEDIDELIGKTGVTLGDCLMHDELFAAYPELRDISIEFVTSEQIDDYAATYNPNTNAVSVNVDTISFWKSFLPKDLFDTELLGTIIHETQHAIQKIEGFASGANIAYWESVRASIARLENAIKSKENEIADNYGKDMLQLAKRYVALFEGVYDRKAVPAEFKKEKRAIEKTADEHKCGGLIRMLLNHHLELRRNEYKLASYTHGEDLYRDTGGEIEAENVRKRLRMDSDAREEARPDIDRENVVFVEDEFYNFGKKRDTKVKSAKNNYEVVAQRAKANGYSEKLYHQTGNDFTVFDTEHQKAGKYDPEMPTGTFLKPDDSDIGLSGKKQMELFTKMKNPLEFRDRADAQRFWMRNIEGYAEALRTIDRINERYSREVARAGMELSEYKKEWRRNTPDADSREIYNDAEFQRLDEAQELIAEEWESRSNEASLEAKKLIDGYMLDSGYDGVVVESDQGSNGKTTKTYVVFDSSQMKSTDTVTYDDNGNEIPVSARFDSSKKDIRYSLPQRSNFASGSRGTEKLYDTPDDLKPNSESEWSAFNRSFANKTNGLKNNKKANIMIYTADYAYFVSADGYMQGRIVGKVLIDGNEERINKMTKEFRDGTFVFREGTNSLAEGIRSNRGRGYRHHASLKEALAAEGYETVDGDEHSSDRGRNNRRSGKTSKDLSYSLPEKPTAEQIGDAYKNGEITREEYDSQSSDAVSEKTEYESIIDGLAEYLKQKNAENNGDLVEISEPEDITAIAIDGKDSIIEADVNAESEVIKCINQNLEGKKHPDAGVPFVRRQVKIDGKKVEVVVPEFESIYDAQLPKTMFEMPDRKQFKECNIQLKKAIEENPEIGKRFTEEQLKNIRKELTPKGYTWHHDVAAGKMQLVDKDTHQITRHTGGRFIWGGGTEKR